MNTIKLRQAHSLSKDLAKSRSENIVSTLQAKFGLTYRWDGDTIRFSADTGLAKGTSGSVMITDSDVQMEVNLPMGLSMMKSFVEKQVSDELVKALR